MPQQKSDNNSDPNRSSLISFNKVKRGALLLRALNNPVRQNIFRFLETNGSSTVTDIMINVRERQTLVSQQLGILRSAKIVSFLRKGKSKHYFINLDRVKEIEGCLTSLIGEDSASKDKDKNIERPLQSIS